VPITELVDTSHHQPPQNRTVHHSPGLRKAAFAGGRLFAGRAEAFCNDDAAFDADLSASIPISIFTVHLSDLLFEIHDGPFLELGLKSIDGGLILMPRRREDSPVGTGWPCGSRNSEKQRRLAR
jgi:hypothetical protein